MQKDSAKSHKVLCGDNRPKSHHTKSRLFSHLHHHTHLHRMPIAKRGSVLEPSSLAENEAWKRKIFRSHLSPGREELSQQDLEGALRKLHLPESRVKDIFARADADGNGWLSYAEFSAYVDRHELELRTAFAAVDTDNSGSISADEIQALLDRMNMSCSPERRDEILKVLDVFTTLPSTGHARWALAASPWPLGLE